VCASACVKVHVRVCVCVCVVVCEYVGVFDTAYTCVCERLWSVWGKHNGGASLCVHVCADKCVRAFAVCARTCLCACVSLWMSEFD